MTLQAGRAQFSPRPGYLNAATMGVPPRAATDAMTGALAQWQRGEACAVEYDLAVNTARDLYARLVGVPASQVAVGSQVSVFAGLVAAALPDGAQVLCVEGDFTSMVFPFLAHADRGVRVRHVPIDRLAEEIQPDTDLVAFSLAQSASGAVVHGGAVATAARAVGARTFCDTTQAVGWMPVDASRFDLSVCAAYKWLCNPRGTAFLTVTPEVAAGLRPIHAGWYAGESVWESCYGPAMELAQDARRFDVSPAWLSWVGAVPALELFASLDMEQVRRHGGGLADSLLTGVGMEPCGRPVVSLPDPDGSRQQRLEAAGCTVAGRAGRVRLAFHLWNDEADVDRALSALR